MRLKVFATVIRLKSSSPFIFPYCYEELLSSPFATPIFGCISHIAPFSPLWDHTGPRTRPSILFYDLPDVYHLSYCYYNVQNPQIVAIRQRFYFSDGFQCASVVPLLDVPTVEIVSFNLSCCKFSQVRLQDKAVRSRFKILLTDL